MSFKDVVVAFDTDAGRSYRLYVAAFDRTPDGAGLTYWVLQADAGLDPRTIANALDRVPDTDGLAFWVNALAGTSSRADVLLAFGQSAEERAKIAREIQNGIALAHDRSAIAKPRRVRWDFAAR